MTVTASIPAMLALETTMMRQTNLERGMHPGPATGMGDSTLVKVLGMVVLVELELLALVAAPGPTAWM